MAKVKARVKAPKTVKKGEVFEVKSLITHKMESGQRKGKDGKKIPRQIINKFVCSYNGEDVFSSNWYCAVSANPYLSFYIKASFFYYLRIEFNKNSLSLYKHKKTK